MMNISKQEIDDIVNEACTASISQLSGANMVAVCQELKKSFPLLLLRQFARGPILLVRSQFLHLPAQRHDSQLIFDLLDNTNGSLVCRPIMTEWNSRNQLQEQVFGKSLLAIAQCHGHWISHQQLVQRVTGDPDYAFVWLPERLKEHSRYFPALTVKEDGESHAYALSADIVYTEGFKAEDFLFEVDEPQPLKVDLETGVVS